MEGEKASVMPSVGEERIGGAYTLRKIDNLIVLLISAFIKDATIA